ncbi:hypothetical protein ACFV2E_35265 [Streptomyces globisporus]|uniref:hypothetical protein n=1 Tax=Streptomyces globisporus TaxID=1908 RepID=UPI0036853BEC
MKPLRTQTAALLQTADELETTVRQVGGWSFQAVDEVLDAIDILIAALCRVGPDVSDVLSPIQRDLVALQTRIAAVAKEPARPRPGRRIPRSATVPHPGDSPEDWIGRDDWVAEQLYLRLRLPGAADAWAWLGRIFNSLPVAAQQKATRRVEAGASWTDVLDK